MINVCTSDYAPSRSRPPLGGAIGMRRAVTWVDRRSLERRGCRASQGPARKENSSHRAAQSSTCLKHRPGLPAPAPSSLAAVYHFAKPR